MKLVHKAMLGTIFFTSAYWIWTWWCWAYSGSSLEPSLRFKVWLSAHAIATIVFGMVVFMAAFSAIVDALLAEAAEEGGNG